MKQFVSLALLVGGVVLLTIDINATNSFSGGYGGARDRHYPLWV